jgi:tetratricopeptide (TPR) repeat protein
MLEDVKEIMKTLIFAKGAGSVVAIVVALGTLCCYFLFGTTSATSKRAISAARLAASKKKFQAMRARYQSSFEAVVALQKKGDLQDAEAGYKAMLRDPDFSQDPQLRMSYAEMLEGMGKREEAMEAVEPLIFGDTWNMDFDAVDLYTRNVRITEGEAGLKAFRDSIRDGDLDGSTLRRYNAEGLTDDEAMDYVRGSYAAGRQDFEEALRQCQKIAKNYPPSFMFYSRMMWVLGALHRQKEVIPLYEDWYRHSSPEMKARIKKRCFLDFKRLDAPRVP